ncbi:MAG: hypothetical protein ACOYNL_09340 [Rickettsiales bacterium]
MSDAQKPFPAEPILDPTTGRPLSFAPRYTVPGVDVAETLQTDRSRWRSEVILQAQPSRNLSDEELNASYAREVISIAKRGLSAREATKARMDAWQELVEPTQPVAHYIIPYYMPVEPGDKISEKLIEDFSAYNADIVVPTEANGEKYKELPYIRGKSPEEPEGNPAIPLNANMVRAVEEAFGTIAAQLPGRFVFQRVDDPDKALINFAAVPLTHSQPGGAGPDSSSIVFGGTYFGGQYHSFMAHVALHEIGHTLGLQHPHFHQKGPGAPSTDKATYLDTVMTYYVNNNAQRDRASLYPVSLMPADLAALQRLYPIKADMKRDGATLGAAPGAVDKNFQVILEQGGFAQSVPFSLHGTRFHPASDTMQDHLRIEQSAPPPNQPLTRKNDVGSEHGYRTIVRSTVAGVVVVKPYGQAEVFIPVTPERITLSPSAEWVHIIGNSNVHSPRNLPSQFKSEARDIIHVSGTNNQITVSAANIVGVTTSIRIQPGAQVALNLRDIRELIRASRNNFPDVLVGDYTNQTTKPQMAVQWRDEGAGKFTVTMRDVAAPGTSPIEVNITLEKATTEDVAAFRRILQQPLYAQYTERKEVTQPDGSKGIEEKAVFSAPVTPVEVTQRATIGHRLPRIPETNPHIAR